MKEQCIHLLQYDHWASIKLLDYINSFPEDIFQKPMNSVFPTLAETFYHIFRGKRIWIKRALPDLVVNESIIKFDDIGEAKNRMTELHTIMIEAIEQHYEELGEVVYHNTKGTTFKNNFDDIIHHLANHGTYHRGNIASMIRECGYKGTSTDYIQFLRDVPRE